MASICCSPTRERAAALVQTLLQAREEVEHAFSRSSWKWA